MLGVKPLSAISTLMAGVEGGLLGVKPLSAISTLMAGVEGVCWVSSLCQRSPLLWLGWRGYAGCQASVSDLHSYGWGGGGMLGVKPLSAISTLMAGVEGGMLGVKPLSAISTLMAGVEGGMLGVKPLSAISTLMAGVEGGLLGVKPLSAISTLMAGVEGGMLGVKPLSAISTLMAGVEGGKLGIKPQPKKKKGCFFPVSLGFPRGNEGMGHPWVQRGVASIGIARELASWV